MEFRVPLRHWLQLSLTDGIGPILAGRIIAAAGSAEAACEAGSAMLAQVEGIGSSRSSRIASSLRSAAQDADAEMERAAKLGVTLLCPDDAEYPILLKTIPDPPNVLYLRGAFEPRDLNAVAIVGSRRCSFYGREQAERFGALLGGAGVTVISGGARGVDSAAHRGALSHPQGRTIAVLGSGVDVPYPAENAALFEQLAARGAVVSEYPLGTSPARENFPRRNRIISGMSRGVLIVEADERSGALITARQAGEDHGRTVFAIPGRVDNPLSTGPHQLIRDGAILTAGLQDILDNLGPLPQGAVETAGAGESLLGAAADPGLPATAIKTPGESDDELVEGIAGLTDRQRTVLAAMSRDATHVDVVVERTSLAAHVVLQELTFLSLKGRVRRIDGQSYARR